VSRRPREDEARIIRQWVSENEMTPDADEGEPCGITKPSNEE
jgi:hypothetical protein